MTDGVMKVLVNSCSADGAAFFSREGGLFVGTIPPKDWCDQHWRTIGSSVVNNLL